MQTLQWDREQIVAGIHERIWLYLSPASAMEDMALEASVLLELGERDVLTLAQVLYLLSDEVGCFLADAAVLLRRLPTTSAQVEERSMERVRGSVRWQKTLLERQATRVPNLFITAPSERAFRTPETELLVFLLAEIVSMSRNLGWRNSKGFAGTAVASRESDTMRLLSTRMLLGVPHARPSQRQISRIRTGRHRRRFASAMAAWELFEPLVIHHDRAELQRAIEQRGLVVQRDDRLFEIWCFFLVLETIASAGWTLPAPRVFPGGLQVRARRADARLDVYFQRLPHHLRAVSRYRALLEAHKVATTDFQPDLVLVGSVGTVSRTLIVELKMGTTRSAGDSVREALQNLLAYEASFGQVLPQTDVVGLGVAWGGGLAPVPQRISLMTSDHVAGAVRAFASAVSDMARTVDQR